MYTQAKTKIQTETEVHKTFSPETFPAHAYNIMQLPDQYKETLVSSVGIGNTLQYQC